MSEIVWNPGISLAAMEEMIIKKAFAHFQKDKTKTAQSLGIAVRTLEYKLQQYEESEQKFKELEDIRKKREEELLQRSRFGRAYIPPEVPIEQTKPVQVTTLRRKAK